MDESLDKLVQSVLDSPKYRQINPDLVERIAREEISKRRSIKEALKATKNKLHQVGGAYFPNPVTDEHTKTWLAQLTESADRPEALKAACLKIMAAHASTRERLPLLQEFYTTTLGGIAPIHSVIDVACGLNPLAIPWMPLAEDARYYAYDIYQHLIEFLKQAIPVMGVQGRAENRDVLGSPPDEQADLALVLKTLPCLEQVAKQAGARLLDGLDVKYMLVSFPARSLGGRAKGMEKSYAAYFETLAAGKPWEVQTFHFNNELVYLVKK